MTGKLTLEAATALAEAAWGRITWCEPCNKPGAWSFESATDGGIIVDASTVDPKDRLLVEPYLAEKDGAYIFDQETGWSIAAFALRTWRKHDLRYPDFLLQAEQCYRRNFFNPRLAAGVAANMVADHPEYLEHVELGLAGWADAHGFDMGDLAEGKPWPGTPGIYAAAQAAAAEIEKNLQEEPALSL